MIVRFPLERGIFLREYSTGTYGAIPYFIANNLVELPKAFAVSVFVWLVVYWLIGFQGAFILFVLVYWLNGVAASGTALLLGSLLNDPEVASQLSPAIFVPQMLFSGFFLPLSQIPEWLRWIQYISTLKYAVNLFVLIEFSDANQHISDPATLAEIDRVLFRDNDIERDLWWLYVLILLLLFVAFRVTALVALMVRAKNAF